MNLPDFKNLNPEQKKKLVLAGLLGAMVLYAGFSFGLTPFMQSRQRAEAELASLRDKLDRAQRTISRESRIRELLQDADAEIREAVRLHIPPTENSLSWVASKVYGSARTVGVDIESVSDLGITSAPWSQGGELQRAFVPYTVRIVTQCGYRELVALIETLESKNPYLCVSEIQVTGQDREPQRHKIRFAVQWPSWGDADEAAEVMNGKDVNRG
jgi:hypothetical protein